MLILGEKRSKYKSNQCGNLQMSNFSKQSLQAIIFAGMKKELLSLEAAVNDLAIVTEDICILASS